MSIQLNGDTGITTPMYNGTVTSNQVTPSVNMKNRIINGAMVIDQRNGGASSSSNQVYTVDRWLYVGSQASKGTWGQNYNSVTPPAGFPNYLGFASSSAYSVVSSDKFSFSQDIEGYNWADMAWGTASAKTVTLSFWVYSSLTGTFGGSVQNYAQTRSYPFTYTISSANTWEQKSITIAGDTSGTWVGATNGGVLQLNLAIGVGSTLSGTAGAWASANYFSATGATSVVGTSGATFYITGVQLEVGSSATSFDYRPYGTELQLCQRYFYKAGGTNVYEHMGYGSGTSSTVVQADVVMPVPMRSAPSVTVSTVGVYDMVASVIPVTSTSLASSGTETSTRISSLNYAVSSGITTYRPYMLIANNSTSAYAWFNSEL